MIWLKNGFPAFESAVATAVEGTADCEEIGSSDMNALVRQVLSEVDVKDEEVCDTGWQMIKGFIHNKLWDFSQSNNSS